MPVLSVGSSQPILEFAVLAPFKRGRVLHHGAVAVLGMHVFDPTRTKFLFYRLPGEIKPYSVEERRIPVRTRSDDHHRRRIGEVPETLLAFAQRNFSPLPLPQRTGLPKRHDQRKEQPADGPSQPSPSFLRLHMLIRSPCIVQPEIG